MKKFIITFMGIENFIWEFRLPDKGFIPDAPNYRRSPLSLLFCGSHEQVKDSLQVFERTVQVMARLGTDFNIETTTYNSNYPFGEHMNLMGKFMEPGFMIYVARSIEGLPVFQKFIFGLHEDLSLEQRVKSWDKFLQLSNEGLLRACLPTIPVPNPLLLEYLA